MDGVINNNMPRQRRANGDGYKTAIFIHATSDKGRVYGRTSLGLLINSFWSME